MNITLNFINNSNDTNPNGVVIFQQNVATAVPEVRVAWVVFHNPAPGVAYPFQYALTSTAAASDAYGNTTSQLSAPNGTRFDMVSSVIGNQLRLSDQQASSPRMVEIYNELPAGGINVMIYNSGLLLAQTTNIIPGQKAAFAFEPTFYLSLVNGIQQGEILDTTITANPDFQFSVLGIRSADIVMTGGGSGAGAAPYLFTLQNVKYA
jgi:hypothetical protein